MLEPVTSQDAGSWKARLGGARLYINDEPVGDVLVQHTGASWSHGRFQPAEAFDAFAPLFRKWSLLMHAGDRYGRLSDPTSDALRRVEVEIDRLHAKLHVLETDQWVSCTQLNIDGQMIEWKCA